MDITKLRILLPFITFPLISFLGFYYWAQSLTIDPTAVSIGSTFVQYLIIYGATIACNGMALWATIMLVAISLTIYGVIRRSAFTFLLLNISLFSIFCLPIFLAIAGITRFCISFVT